jgi:hypothetical protein
LAANRSTESSPAKISSLGIQVSKIEGSIDKSLTRSLCLKCPFWLVKSKKNLKLLV